MRLKGHVMSFQTHYRSFEMNTWLWIYGTFSKIPRLINTHHGIDKPLKMATLEQKRVSQIQGFVKIVPQKKSRSI